MRLPACSSMVWPDSSTRGAVKLALSDAVGWAPVLASSGARVMVEPGPRVSAPPMLARLTNVPVLLKPVAVPLRASSSTEPFSLTLLLAERRPLWLTARPTSVVLPRALPMSPVLSTAPAPPTSTSRPRSAGMAGLTSDAYSTSRVGSCKYTLSPAASTVWPPGVLMRPAFCTSSANRKTRPPDGVVICAPAWTATKPVPTAGAPRPSASRAKLACWP